MTATVTLFYPPIQPNETLTGAQKYLLRVVFGWAGKTILHRERVVEVLETRASLRQILPLVETDLSESNASPFWIPTRQSDRKRFNIERRDKSRRHLTIGIVSGDPRPADARRETLRSVFPSPRFLHHLVTEMGYPPGAALAAFARPRRMGEVPDRRRAAAFNSDEQFERKANKGYQRLDYGDNIYIREAPSRRTETGGGFTEKQVRQGLSRMRADGRVGHALFEIVYRRRSTKQLAEEFDLKPKILYVYATRLRGHIRRQQDTTPAVVPSHMVIPDFHGGENLVPYIQ